MWKRSKNSGSASSRQSFSIVHQYIQHFNEVSGNKTAVIRRRSKIPGVLITQYVVNIPEGKSTPDFQSKPMPVAVQEGALAVFKAVVKGDPKPEVSWRRTKGAILDNMTFQRKYDESTGEHILEIHKVSEEETDTYKCSAVNEYGKAVCTATLTLADASTNPTDFRKLLRKSKVVEDPSKLRDAETERRFWDAMLNADRRDYERICAEFGVAESESILQTLQEKKRERVRNKCKDGVIPYAEDATKKHSLDSSGIGGLMKKYTGLNLTDVEELNLLNTELNPVDEEVNVTLTEYKLSNVDFVIKIQEIQAEEKEDALFECVLTHPLPSISWMSKGSVLEDDEKYSITVSDHKLIHRLLVKDCMQPDKGIYTAVAGGASCNAWLVVEDESDPASDGKKKARKTSVAGGARVDLEKVAREQQMKNREEMGKILASVKAKQEGGQVTDGKTLPTSGRNGESGRVDFDKVTEYSGESFALNQTQTLESQNKAADVDGNKGTAVSAKCKKNTKKVQWKDNTTDPNREASDDKVSDGDENEETTDKSNCSTPKKRRSKVAVNDPKDPNREASDDEVSDGDEIEETTDKSNRSTSKKRQSKVAVNDPNREASDDKVSDSDENEETTDKSNRSTSKKRKSKVAVNDPNREARDDEVSDGDENEETTDKSNRSTSKKRQSKVAVNDPNREASDDEVSDSDENEETTDKSNRSTSKKRKSKVAVNDPNREASDDEVSDGDENEETTDKSNRSTSKIRKSTVAVNDDGTDPKDHSECDENEDATDSAKKSRRKRQGPLIEDVVIDPGVQFIWGLSDVSAVINETAELTCKLSSDDCEGVWFRDGKKIIPDENFAIAKDGPIHKLLITGCKEEHSGKYRFEADGRKTEAMINVKDPPRFEPEDLRVFTQPLTVKLGHNAIFKLQFVGHEPIKVKWYKEGEELQPDNNTRIEKSENHSRLMLTRCQRKDSGEIRIKLKNEHGFTEAISQLIVLDKPTPPLGPAEVTESSAVCIEFRWRPPKDDGGSPVINYTIERQQVGRNTWKKLGEIPGVPVCRDTDVDHGRKYCYRIRAGTAEGTSEVMETDEMQAGTLAFPGPPSPPKVVSACDDCINISWESPSNRGGSRILGYILEKRKNGSNLWTVVNAMDELIKEKKCAVKDVVAGIEYEFRVAAINLSGVGEFSSPSEFVFARDPKKPPGKVTGLKVTETSYSHLVLTWTKPEDRPGIQDEAKGYFVEIRQADCMEWSRCNTTSSIMTSYSVKGLKSMDMYWARVIATNDGGESAPEELPNYVLAMPLPVRPKFTNNKMKSFMVVRAGNSVRITMNFEASPQPHIMWMKDNAPVTKRVTISNSDGSSQMLIPSSERSDSGIYSLLVKNLVGQETFSIEVRVTDDPKPPGPVELEENVPGTVTVIWEPSPDEKRDDRLHYTVSKLDSTKRAWSAVADRLFNNKFTVCNIMQGRQYNFRVYAKNDMGISAHSESPTWGMEKKKEKFVVDMPSRKDCDLQCAPTFIVPLKLHTAPKGYECYMSCAVKGNPSPRVTWYRNHISLNTNTNYYISNTCGVCSMLILHVGPKDMGEYTITAENALGRAECSTILSVTE